MKFIRPLIVVSVCALLSSTAWAADKKDVEKVNAQNVAAASGKNDSASEKAVMEKMDSQMKVMQDMHEKMMNAKTPQERKAHMAEHMKAMQGGMSMMGSMKAGNGMKNTMSVDMETRYQMMEKRMQLMENMMQMMMDRSSIPETFGQ